MKKESVPGAYIRQLFGFAKKKTAVSFILALLLGLTQGVGLVMILPFLHTLGLTERAGGSGGFTGAVSGIFNTLGLPLNLYTVLGVYVLVVSFFGLLRRYRAVLDVEIQQEFVCFLRNRLYRALTYADWLFTAREKASAFTHGLIQDIPRIGQGTYFLLQFSSSAALVCFNIAVAFLLSFTLTGAALGFGVLMFYVLKPLSRAAFNTGKVSRKLKRVLMGEVFEHLTGMKTAKSFGVESHHIERVETVNREISREAVAFSRVRADTAMFYQISGVLFLAGFLALAVDVFHVPTGRLLLLGFIFTRLMPRFASIHQQYQGIQNMLPAFSAAQELYVRAREASEDMDTGNGGAMELRHSVSFREVSFSYTGGRRALDTVSFEIPAGEITAVMGPSGAGKSTLADLLLGLLRPEGGKILADGVEITAKNVYGWRYSIGYVPQDTFLFHDTIRANLLWARPGAGEEQLWESLEMAAAADFVRALPGGLDTVAGDRGVSLSGGERQRIALARALLRKPKLLLLDEATGALDAENEQRIMEAVQALEGLTVVIISHRRSTEEWARHTIRLERGKIV